MMGTLKYIGLFLLVAFGIPLTTIYRQNIETWAADRGLDGVLSKGVAVLNANPLGPWLLLAFVFILGGTAALWFEYFLRKKFPLKFSNKTLVEGKKFKHTKVVIDGKSFKRCSFDGVRLIYSGTGYFDFIECHFGDFSIGVETDAVRGAFHLIELAQQSGRPIKFEDDKPLLPQALEEEKPH